MFRNILVEGPDCSGKSTLVERLKNTFKKDSKSLRHQPGDQFQRYLREYALAENLVLDRGHLSEHVYSTIWRGGTPFSEKEKNMLNDIVKYKFLIIFSCPPLELIEKRYCERKFTQEIKLEELPFSRNLFIESLRNLGYLHYQSRDLDELNIMVEKVSKILL